MMTDAGIPLMTIWYPFGNAELPKTVALCYPAGWAEE